jgi:hypothetical protein
VRPIVNDNINTVNEKWVLLFFQTAIDR